MSTMSRVREFLARRDGIAQLAVVLGAVAAYEASRLAMDPNWAQAFTNARRIVSLEQVLGVAWEQSLQRAFLALPDLVNALNVFYCVGHFLITGVFFFWLYHRSREGFRSFRDGFLAATAIALVIHWLYPTAPPRLAGVGIEDTLRVLSGIDIGSPTSSALSNPVSAVPFAPRCLRTWGGGRHDPLRPLAPDSSRRRDLPAAGRLTIVVTAITSCSTRSPGWRCSASVSGSRERFAAGRRGSSSLHRLNSRYSHEREQSATINAASRGGAVR